MMIPTKFTLLSHDIEVVIDNEYCHNNQCMGRFIPWENKIIVADKYKTKKQWRAYKKDIVHNTFLHELVHCMLYHTGYQDLWLDEVLVSILAGMLQQFLKLENNEV